MIRIPLPPVMVRQRYQLFSVNPVTGKETPLSGEFGNTLLTSGRNELSQRNWFISCHVGTNNTPPDATQGGLFGFVAATSDVIEDTNGTETDYGWRRKRFRFPVGAAAGNLNEIAIAWSNADGDCVTRALTEDINGNQNTIVPKVDEFLDAVIEVQYWWPQVDVTGTVVIDSVTYDYTIRPSQVNVQSAWSQNIGQRISSFAIVNSDWAFYDGDLALPDAPPNGVRYDNDNSADFSAVYSSGSYEQDVGINSGPGGWNATTGNLARTLVFKTTAGWWQCQFDSQASPGSGIPITSGFTCESLFTVAWSEKP